MKKDTTTTHTHADAAHANAKQAAPAVTPLPTDAPSPVPATTPAPAAGLGATGITPSTPAVPLPPPTGPSLLTMATAQATASVAAAAAAVAQAQSHLAGLVALPEAQRKVIGGRFRDGEPQVLLAVLAECAARPELVASLADEDNGVDPNTFETTLLSSRIQLAMLLAPLSATLTEFASNLNDTVLYLNELTRPPTLEAYAILKAVSKTDLSVKTAIAPALDFYANIAKVAAATRKRNATAKANAATPAAAAPVVQVGATAPTGTTAAK